MAQRVDGTRIIDLHVNAEANNRSVGGTVAEGQGFRMTFDRVGSFEIVPVVLDEAQGRFRVTVYRGPVNSDVSADRALAWSDVARAAAGCGEAEVFEDAWARAYGLAAQENVEPFRVDILLNLAHAAATRSDPVRGGMAARRALELAKERKEAQLMLEAEAVLDSLQARKVFPPPQMPAGHGDIEIAQKFVQALQVAGAA